MTGPLEGGAGLIRPQTRRRELDLTSHRSLSPTLTCTLRPPQGKEKKEGAASSAADKLKAAAKKK